MALLLVLATLAFLTQSSPIIQKRNVSGKTKWCGTEFSEALKTVCFVYKSIWRVTPVEPTEGECLIKGHSLNEHFHSGTRNLDFHV